MTTKEKQKKNKRRTKEAELGNDEREGAKKRAEENSVFSILTSQERQDSRLVAVVEGQQSEGQQLLLLAAQLLHYRLVRLTSRHTALRVLVARR